MKSRYRNRCIKCGNTIEIGDDISKDPELNKWVHTDCPAGINVPIPIKDFLSEGSTNGNGKVHNEGEGSFNTDFTPSKYQKAVFKFIEKGKGNGVIEAVAGSGKTTTIIKALELLPKDVDVVFLSFNGHIAREIGERLQQMGLGHIQASTIHSLGLSICRKLSNMKWGREGIDRDKLSGLMDKWYPIGKDVERDVKRVHFGKRNMLRHITSLAKATLVDADDAEAVLEMLERYNIDDTDGYAKEAASHLPELLQMCIDHDDTVDFDDMPWMPITHPRLINHFPKYQFVMIDEAQDLNACQIKFVMNLVAHDGRVIAVGDRHQSLYGFRGADTEAIPRLIDMLDAKIMPLSISYRCPISHVKLAQGFVPEIEASETAKAGEVKDIEYLDFLKQVKVGDMVICRVNAPLMKPAFHVIRGGEKAVIRGSEIGDQLVKFVERFNAEDLSKLYPAMNQYLEAEVERLLNKSKELQAEMLIDKVETIKVVANECKTVIELTNKLNLMYSNDNVGVVFSTVHRAKGLQAKRIWILKPELLPHPKARQGWEMEQEDNIHYVALTRSMEQLYFVNGG